jgi:osmotically-inducible protein OsmY
LPSLHIIPEQINVNLESTSQGNVATLNGIVASERERKVMKQLLLLEPGIDKVENKLMIK